MESETTPADIAVLSSTEHAGSLVEHLSCSSAQALQELVRRCNREGRRIVAARPQKLPPEPAQRVNYFVTLSAGAVIEHCPADQVISVEAGISIKDLQSMLSEHRQWFPVCLPDENVSLMEYINNGSSGALEHGFGEARDLVLGMQVVLGSGELIKCGGKVVKNVTGYDLPKLMAGSRGTLCIPYSAHLRLFALPEKACTLAFRFKESGLAFKAAADINRSGLPLSCLEIVDEMLFSQLSPERMKVPPFKMDPGDTFLFVEIHGIAEVVQEMERALKDILSAETAVCEKLDYEQARELWSFLSGPSEFMDCDWVELAATNRDLESLLCALKVADPAIAFSARPSRNKAFVSRSGNAREKLSLLEMLEMQAALVLKKQAKWNATVAYADRNYAWRVRSLPTEDAVQQELKRRLRLQYDPQSILNPLAIL